MEMTLPQVTLKDLLGLIHYGTSLLILDETTNQYIEDVDEYDGYDDHHNYLVEGIRLTSDHRLMVIVKPY